MFLSVLKICCKFKRKHPSRSAVSIKLQSKTASEISTLFSFLKEKKEFHTIINLVRFNFFATSQKEGPTNVKSSIPTAFFPNQ